MSVKDALLKYNARQLRKGSRSSKRRNQKPEYEVVKSLLDWTVRQGWSIHKVESKAVYSASAGRYLRGPAVEGFSDLVGNDSQGRAIFIEAKAPGKKATLRPAQAVFLKEKIRTNSFAICVDSVELLNTAYVFWNALDMVKRQKYLMSMIPKKFEDL